MPILERFYDNLIADDATAIRSLFGPLVALDTPLSGAVDGDEALTAFVRREGEFLRRLNATPRLVGRFESQDRVIVELVLDLIEGDRFDLPVVMVGQKSDHGFGQVRFYHSTWPLNGEHEVRAPIVWPSVNLNEPRVIRRYFDTIGRGNANEAMATFALAGYVQEPSGSAYRHAGVEGREAFYATAFAEPGGCPLIPATATFDGSAFAVEYICDRWGRSRFAPMAGCAVYDLTPDREAISAVRIYDDVSPPSEAEPAA